MSVDACMPAEVYSARFAAVRAAMEKQGLDGLILLSARPAWEGCLVYLANYRIPVEGGVGLPGFDYAALVIPAGGPAWLVAPRGVKTRLPAEVEQISTGIELGAGLMTALKQSHLSHGKIGIAGLDRFPVESYFSMIKSAPEVTFSPADGILSSLRAIKTPTEIGFLRESARAADAALEAGLSALGSGVAIYEVESRMQTAAFRAGFDTLAKCKVSRIRPSLPPGENPQGGPELKSGELVLLEVTGWRNQYAGRIARAAVVGAPDAGQQDYLDHLADAVEWMIAEFRAEKPFRFNLTASRGRVIHPMAHGIGLDPWEEPLVLMQRDFVLQAGMALCVEPAVISKTLGEAAPAEMVLITPDGPQTLTHCPLRTVGRP